MKYVAKEFVMVRSAFWITAIDDGITITDNVGCPVFLVKCAKV